MVTPVLDAPRQDTLVDTDAHRICRLRGTGEGLVVAIAGVGRHRHRMPPFEFADSASDGGRNHVLLASDGRRSWMNDSAFRDTLVAQVEAVRREAGIRHVTALGNSMGGFMALALAGLTAIDCVIAFSPQYSMHPAHVPEETRWRYWRERFPAYLHETAGPLSGGATRRYVFHGDSPEEAIHWRRFPEAPGLHHYIVHGAGHRLALELRQRGILKRVIRQAIADRPRRVRMLLEAQYDVTRRGADSATIAAPASRPPGTA